MEAEYFTKKCMFAQTRFQNSAWCSSSVKMPNRSRVWVSGSNSMRAAYVGLSQDLLTHH